PWKILPRCQSAVCIKRIRLSVVKLFSCNAAVPDNEDFRFKYSWFRTSFSGFIFTVPLLNSSN
ncbi:MAG TPA: hypothetical protein PK358_08220, partial [Spirochaetota bacterium]|nr:hypothetical protein [Spirochaetota bacterium]